MERLIWLEYVHVLSRIEEDLDVGILVGYNGVRGRHPIYSSGDYEEVKLQPSPQ